MSTICRLIAVSFFIVCSFTLSVAQETDFNLASGRVGEAYQQSIERVLADKYGMRLESGVRAAVFEWIPVENLPPGLKLNGDGTITGVPQAYQAQPYRFKVKVIDRAMRDAEALELSFSIELMAPRIRLVKNNAPRLVPVYSAPEPASLPAASTPVASAEVAGNGNGHPVATSESPTAQPIRESRFAPASEVQTQNAGNQNTPPTQATGATGALESLNITHYISIIEETTGGNKFTLTLPGKVIDDLAHLAKSKVENQDLLKALSETERENLLKPFEGINFKLRSDRESTLVIQRKEPPSTACSYQPGEAANPSGLRYLVSAELVQEKGSTPLSLIGTPVTPVFTQSAALVSPGSLLVQLNTESPLATLNLKQAGADANDQVRLVVEAACASTDPAEAARVLGRRSYDIELTNFGWESGVSPSVFLINRHSVRREDEQPSPATTMPGSLTSPINPVNYSPFTGASYIFSYKGEQRNKGKLRGKILSFLQPGFGLNATFMDFGDQAIDFQNIDPTVLRDKIFDKNSDVQIGLGAVATFFGNKIQITYGGNLAVDRKRGYFGFGLDFLKLFDLFK